VRRRLYLLSLGLGILGLFVAGWAEKTGVALVFLALLTLVAARPFVGRPPRQRVAARLGATGAVMAGWILAGTLHWDWGPRDWAVAGAIALAAIARAATPRTA
jgi:hypothetical protein